MDQAIIVDEICLSPQGHPAKDSARGRSEKRSHRHESRNRLQLMIKQCNIKQFQYRSRSQILEVLVRWGRRMIERVYENTVVHFTLKQRVNVEKYARTIHI
jgi:hypothetical protein